ncbi:hypothetical protein DESC_610214 [Desulfosarcina cetonica]|nr:hypothetical protein DESC_610214 [Desulfosarcina cetonica]
MPVRRSPTPARRTYWSAVAWHPGEQTRDFVYIETGPVDRTRALDGTDPRWRVGHLADLGHGDTALVKVGDEGGGEFGTTTDQETAGADQAQRIDAQDGSHATGLGKDRHLIAPDANPPAAGLAQFGERRGDAALGHVVQGRDPAHTPGDTCLGQDADHLLKGGAGIDLLDRHALVQKQLPELGGDDRRALHGHALGHQHPIAGRHAALTDQVVACDGAGHHAGHHRPADCVGNFGVSAAQGDALVGAGSVQVGKNLPHLGARKVAGQKEGGQHPVGRGAGRGQIVGIDRNRVTADGCGGKGDRIGFKHQHRLALDVHGGRILPHGGAHDYRRVVHGVTGQKLGEKGVGQFAGRQCQAVGDDRLELVQGGGHEIAIQPLGQGRTVAQVSGQSAGPATGLHVEKKIAHHQDVRRVHAQPLGGQAHALTGRFDAHRVLTGHHDADIGHREIGEMRQGLAHGCTTVAGENADGQPDSLEPGQQRLGAGVRPGGGSAVQFEAVQLPGHLGQANRIVDPGHVFEHGGMVGATDNPFNNGKIEGTRTGQGAVKIENHRIDTIGGNRHPISRRRLRGSTQGIAPEVCISAPCRWRSAGSRPRRPHTWESCSARSGPGKNP